ncbi:MAG: MFS transporter [Alphaproteobacteria bacterium]|nr:MAG: MFS transporter [Alphaproteobacteria bacterium]
MRVSAGTYVQGFAALGHFYVHLFTAFYAVMVLALEREWQMPYHQLIALWTIPSFLVGVGAIPAGWLADRWSARGMMAVFFIGIGASSILCGLAQSPLGLVAGLCGIGLFASIYHPVGIPWLVRNAVARGKALGFNGIFGNAGVAVGMFATGLLIAFAGWRTAFILPGVLSIATGFAFVRLIRRDRVGEGSITHREPPASRGDMVRAFVVLLVTMLVNGIVYQAMQTAAPKLFEDRLPAVAELGTAAIGTLVGIIYLAAGVIQLVGGHLADRYSLKPVYVLGLMLQVPLLYAVAMLGSFPLLVVVMLNVVVSTAILPAENMMLARFSPEKHRSLSFGIKYVFAFGSAPLAVQFVSFVHGNTGDFYWLFMALAAMAAVAFAAAVFLPPAGRSARAAAPAAAE